MSKNKKLKKEAIRKSESQSPMTMIDNHSQGQRVKESGIEDKRQETKSYHLISISLILVISIAIYSNTLKNGFVYDDAKTIVNNTLIKTINNLPKLFNRTDYFAASGEMSYRPVVTLTYFIDYAIYGLKPYGYHLTNLIIHSINGVMLYIFLTLLFKSSQSSFFNFQFPIFNLQLIISLLFITHPVLTEAVNAISFREDGLCFLFFISALILYLKSSKLKAQSSKFKAFSLQLSAFSFYLLALLSKEMAITFPLIIILYEWIYGKQPPQSPFVKGELKGVRRLSQSPLLKGVRGLLFNPYTIGYILITILYLYLRFFLFHNPVEEDLNAWLLSERLMTIPYLIMKYIMLLIAPISLSADYVITPVQSLFSPLFLVSMFVIILLSFITYKLAPLPSGERDGVRGIIFGILFLLLTLLPVDNIIPIVNPFAERYLYLPSVGFAIIIGSILSCLPVRSTQTGLMAHSSWRVTHHSSLIAHCSLLIIIISIYSFAVIQRNKIWIDDYSLWSDTVIKMPESSRAHYNLGNAFRMQGRLDEALKELNLALFLKPSLYEAHNNLGIVYEKLGQLDEAIKEYRMAIKLKPYYSKAHNNLGLIYEEQGRIDEAIKEYKLALSLKPDFAEAHNNLGVIYANMGQIDEAIKEFKLALSLNPDDVKAHNNLGNAYNEQGQLDESIKELKLALSLKPDYAKAHNNLGIVYKKQGRLDEALKEFLTALKLNPDDVITHYNMALAYNLKGLKEKAIEELEIALRLKPDHIQARELLESLRRR